MNLNERCIKHKHTLPCPYCEIERLNLENHELRGKIKHLETEILYLEVKEVA